MSNQQEMYETEEDKLLDPIAKSILRSLQENAAQHFTSNHSPARPEASPTLTTIDEGESGEDDEDSSPCDVDKLTPNQLIHCNAALEQDGKDSDGDQGGQVRLAVLRS